MAERERERKEIPFCPLMSAGSDVDMVCTQERCAWYLSSIKNVQSIL